MNRSTKVFSILVLSVSFLFTLSYSTPAIDIGKQLGGVTQIGKYSEQLKQLYDQLMGFKDDPKFHKVGFDSCCEFADWKEKLSGISESSDASGLEKKASFSMGALAQEYLKTKGTENETTKALTDVIKSSIGKQFFK